MPTASELRTQIVGLVRTLAPEVLAPVEAMDLVRELSTIEKAAATGRMLAALRVARTDTWRGQGHASAADWLAAQAGISVREAAAQLGTAKRAERLPETDQAMRNGKLSPGQADAVTDAASADPTAEQDLLDSAANDTTAALREKAAKTRAAATDTATKERRARAQRSMRSHTDAHGAFHLNLQGPAVDGVRILALLRPHQEQAFREARSNQSSGDRDTYDNRSYDAFLSLLGVNTSAPSAQPSHSPATGAGATPPAAATSTPNPAAQPPPAPIPGRPIEYEETDRGRLDGLPSSATSGPDGQRPPPPAATPASRPPGGDNIKVIVRIDHTALLRGHTVAGETCDIPGYGPIPVAAARELMQDAFLAAILTKGNDVCTVAHLGRNLSAHQRTAIEALGLRCSNRACNRTIAIQIDHRTPWAAHQETKLDNQDPLCPGCHNLKTHHGWALEPGTGPRRFTPPPTPPTPPTPPPPTPQRGPAGRRRSAATNRDGATSAATSPSRGSGPKLGSDQARNGVSGSSEAAATSTDGVVSGVVSRRSVRGPRSAGRSGRSARRCNGPQIEPAVPSRAGLTLATPQRSRRRVERAGKVPDPAGAEGYRRPSHLVSGTARA